MRHNTARDTATTRAYRARKREISANPEREAESIAAAKREAEQRRLAGLRAACAARTAEERAAHGAAISQGKRIASQGRAINALDTRVTAPATARRATRESPMPDAAPVGSTRWWWSRIEADNRRPCFVRALAVRGQIVPEHVWNPDAHAERIERKGSITHRAEPARDERRRAAHKQAPASPDVARISSGGAGASASPRAIPVPIDPSSRNGARDQLRGSASDSRAAGHASE